MKKVFIFINGILTNPGDAHGWTDRAVTWIQTHTPHHAEKFEYFSFALTRRFHQTARVRNVVQLIDRYSDTCQVILVGHSNGCDIILRALKYRAMEVQAVHLFAAAAEPDCRRNWLNYATQVNKRFESTIYASHGDRALGLFARASRFLFGWMGLGYGTMGYDGPTHVFHPQRIRTLRNDDMDHSDWFKPGENFERSMFYIIRPEKAGGAQ